MLRTALAAVTVLLVAGTTAGAAGEGAALYGAQCARCHGNRGDGDTPSGKAVKIRPLNGDPKLEGAAPAAVAKRIRESPAHAPFAGDLTSEELDGVVARVEARGA